MAYGIVWDEAAVYGAARHLADDPGGLRQLLYAVGLLSGEPRPRGAAVHGPGLCRIHVGRYRVLYAITRDPGAVVILHVGRLG
ncbi:type II toxin-antitoxin system RelE family toxin [Streptomyces yangpuensis]|uniref:Type II toxin-antitoxin system RelE/ParE family toxin n=1 Tax=Streptomyces yangpuensis TaxID=1648182 RepID=A0ABY5PQE8_9ACTN|nr:type II toxin-antitoxin system RelE/ParE family toxin [Streptomyces yangpuensis]MBZ9593865.1 type II toxin-antitoxin system RelE/ParE family toxin [Streptomyces erythrochromogenes]UUY45908.1 type II toxin-antitoxin system RelE/ParE family toxin [Streptomyces yangpuensis]